MPHLTLEVTALLARLQTMLLSSMRVVSLCLFTTSLAHAVDQPMAGLQDPTQPPSEVLNRMPQTAEQTVIAPILTAVKSQGKDSFAVINQTMLRLGDKLQDSRLIAVTANSATLINDAQQKTVLTLVFTDYRKPVAPEVPHQKPAKRKGANKNPVVTPAAQSLK